MTDTCCFIKTKITSLWLQRKHFDSSLSRQIGARSDAFETVAIVYQSVGVFSLRNWICGILFVVILSIKFISRKKNRKMLFLRLNSEIEKKRIDRYIY